LGLKGLLLHVAADYSSVGVCGPIFPDGSFEFIPVIEWTPGHHRNTSETRTYDDLHARNVNASLSQFVPLEYKNSIPHYDPDPQNFTFSEPLGSIRGSQISRLDQGDLLFFVASLAPSAEGDYRDNSLGSVRASQKGRMAKYVIGSYRIESVLEVVKDDSKGRCRVTTIHGANAKNRGVNLRLSRNAHFRRFKDHFVCAIGLKDRKTLLLKKAVKLTQQGQPFRPTKLGQAVYGRRNFPRGFKWITNDRLTILASAMKQCNS
jgi:hypothetical protein